MVIVGCSNAIYTKVDTTSLIYVRFFVVVALTTEWLCRLLDYYVHP